MLILASSFIFCVFGSKNMVPPHNFWCNLAVNRQKEIHCRGCRQMDRHPPTGPLPSAVRMCRDWVEDALNSTLSAHLCVGAFQVRVLDLDVKEILVGWCWVKWSWFWWAGGV